MTAQPREYWQGAGAPPSSETAGDPAGGEHFACDGVFYSFVNDSGQGVKLWVPPVDGPVRGVILHGNPGGGFGGDTRSKTRQRDLLEFAARHDFAVAGVTGFSGRRTYPDLAPILLRAFEGWGQQGDRPELAHLPFISTGGSNAGVFSFSMMCAAPERAIAITPNCGPIYPEDVPDGARNVPAWMHVGTVDPLMPAGVENTERLFDAHAPHGVLWAWDAEIKGHENGSADHVDVAYWDAIIPLRLPETIEPGEPVELRRIDPNTGWWVDQRSWDHTITRVAPASDRRNSRCGPGRYGWVPTEGIARIYQATASRARLITLSAADREGVEGGETSGVYLSSGGSLVARPGETVRVQVELANMVWGMDELEIYDRAERIGVLDLTEGSVFAFTVDGSKRIYSLHARGIGRRGVERTSNPLQVIVVDPGVSARIDQQLATVSLPARVRADAPENTDFDRLESTVAPGKDLPDYAVGAVRLTGEQAGSLQADGTVSGLWRQLAGRAAPIRIGSSDASRGETDASVVVQAAYAPDGLYLYFRISDTTLGQAEEGSLAGSLDFHLASIGLGRVRGVEPSPDLYSHLMSYSILRNALQIQIPVANEPDGVQRVSFNYWDPWDPVTFRTSSKESYAGLGLWIDQETVDDGSRSVELFMPWHLVGNPGLASLPPAGSSLAIVLGYNPGGGGALRWPLGRDPWAVTPVDRRTGERTNVYGEIILLK